MSGTGTILIDRIRELLGAGYQPALIATTLGCEPSYITQLMSNEKFRNEVQQIKLKSLRASSLRDEELDNMEDKLIAKLNSALPMMIQPAMILKSFQIINAARRRSIPVQEQTVIHNTIVNLEIPQNTSIQFRSNSKNEIIEVEGRPLATLPSNTLASMAETLSESRNQSLTYQDLNHAKGQNPAIYSQDREVSTG